MKDLILMAHIWLHFESKGVLPGFWLALAEGVDGYWEMKIGFDKKLIQVWKVRLFAIPSEIYQSVWLDM